MKSIAIPPEFRAASAASPVRGNVMAALQSASAQTGADFEYLLKTATRESSLNPEAKAATSSATGLFQFIEQTWLATVKKHGAEHGLDTYAQSIEQGADGRYKVAGSQDRQAILALRKDPQIAAVMAGEMTVDMASGLKSGLRRPVSSGELYAAHVMGLGGALKLIKAAEADPAARAADLFPSAAHANKSIFYGENGTARSTSEVLAKLAAKHDRAAPVVVAAANVDVAAAPFPTDLRGSYSPAEMTRSTRLFTPGTAESYILSPIMVQILGSLDDYSRSDDETIEPTQNRLVL